MDTPKSSVRVVPQETTRTPVESFAVMLPDAPGAGMVGTILRVGPSAMIWFGWGNVAPGETVGIKGTATGRAMGSMIVAMPRTQYRGAFSADAQDATSSKMIGSENEDEETIARQMSTRLSRRLGIPVFVSASLEGAPKDAIDGEDEGMVQQKASALVEKVVYRILSQSK